MDSLRWYVQDKGCPKIAISCDFNESVHRKPMALSKKPGEKLLMPTLGLFEDGGALGILTSGTFWDPEAAFFRFGGTRGEGEFGGCHFRALPGDQAKGRWKERIRQRLRSDRLWRRGQRMCWTSNTPRVLVEILMCDASNPNNPTLNVPHIEHSIPQYFPILSWFFQGWIPTNSSKIAWCNRSSRSSSTL